MSASRRAEAALLGMAIAFTGFVVVVVNVLIYWSRAQFNMRHPDFVLRQPPTISKAISDPIIGEPFAGWMAISAPLLFLGIIGIALGLLLDLRRQSGQGFGGLKRAVVLACLLITLQGLAAIGMYILSHYRHGGMHMTGSYLFFFSQAFVVVVGEMLSRGISRYPNGSVVISVRMARFRRRFVWVPIVLGVSYLGLFVLKNFDTGAVYDPLYQLYVWTEPMLLSSFLIYLLTFHVDTYSAIRRHLRAS